jgi:hypothetical protein
MNDRDREIIRYIANQGYVTLEQVKSKFFKYKPNARRTLRRLIDMGFLSDQIISEHHTFSRLGIEREHICEYLSVGAKSRAFSLTKNAQIMFGISKMVKKEQLFIHQLLLSQAQELIDLEVKGLTLNEPKEKLNSSILKNRLDDVAPDFVMDNDLGLIALELERSLKRPNQYIKRFFNYERSVYTHVLYVVTKQHFLQELSRFSRTSKKIGFMFIGEPALVLSGSRGFMSVKEYLLLNKRVDA